MKDEVLQILSNLNTDWDRLDEATLQVLRNYPLNELIPLLVAHTPRSKLRLVLSKILETPGQAPIIS